VPLPNSAKPAHAANRLKPHIMLFIGASLFSNGDQKPLRPGDRRGNEFGEIAFRPLTGRTVESCAVQVKGRRAGTFKLETAAAPRWTEAMNMPIDRKRPEGEDFPS
jgi:hypothetical protein